MSVRSHLYGQFKQPNGALGKIAGLIMAHRPSNIARNDWTIDLLDIQPTDHVLEIGFGPGVALTKILERAYDGRVYGIDHSETMKLQASKRNRKALKDNRLILKVGTPEGLQDACTAIDKVYSVNVAQFWQDPAIELNRIKSVMKSNGLIGTTYLPRHKGASSEDTKKFAAQLAAALREAEFKNIKDEYRAFDNLEAVCVLANAP